MIHQDNGPRWFYLGSEHQARVRLSDDGVIVVQARREIELSDGSPTDPQDITVRAEGFFSEGSERSVFVRDGKIVASEWADEEDEVRSQELTRIALEKFAMLHDAVMNL